MKSSSKPTHSGAVIFRRNNGNIEMLLTKRVGGKVPGFFLTQGHIENGETTEQAIRREIVEETGITDCHLVSDLGVISRKGLKEDGIWYQKVINFFLFETATERRPEWTCESPDGKTFQLKFFLLKETSNNLYFEEERKVVSHIIFSPPSQLSPKSV